MSAQFSSHPEPDRPDPRLLVPRDRAVLRILNRSKAATSRQLSELTRAHLRKVQHRTRLLWKAGYVERRALSGPATGRGPIAYRLTPYGRRRLGYRDRRAGGINELQHRIDTVEAVAALAREYRTERFPMQAWLTESMAEGLLGARPLPDSVVVLQLPHGSGVVCIETDEATQHLRAIEDKLVAYQQALVSRPGWAVLFVVPSLARLRWVQRRAGSLAELRGWDQGLIVELTALRRLGLGALVERISAPRTPVRLDLLVKDERPRECSTPVGSPAWLELLASGGGEDLRELLL